MQLIVVVVAYAVYSKYVYSQGNKIEIGRHPRHRLPSTIRRVTNVRGNTTVAEILPIVVGEYILYKSSRRREEIIKTLKSTPRKELSILSGYFWVIVL